MPKPVFAAWSDSRGFGSMLLTGKIHSFWLQNIQVRYLGNRCSVCRCWMQLHSSNEPNMINSSVKPLLHKTCDSPKHGEWSFSLIRKEPGAGQAVWACLPSKGLKYRSLPTLVSPATEHASLNARRLGRAEWEAPPRLPFFLGISHGESVRKWNKKPYLSQFSGKTGHPAPFN